MKPKSCQYVVLFLSMTLSISAQQSVAKSEDYLLWNTSKINKIGKQMRKKGKVGNSFDFRVIHTERAVNYKLRATLMTPELIRASARREQLINRLTDEQTRALVKEAESVAHLVVLVELDPREGSGVIPLDWRVFLQPRGLKIGSKGTLTGVKAQKLKRVKALSGVFRRDYDYDVFWVSFPLIDKDGIPLLSADTSQIELIIGIYTKEGRVVWNMPRSIRNKIRNLSSNNKLEKTNEK